MRAGEVTSEQANRESSVLNAIMKAYEVGEMKDKLEALEAVLEMR